jgi:hypothetical protein
VKSGEDGTFSASSAAVFSATAFLACPDQNLRQNCKARRGPTLGGPKRFEPNPRDSRRVARALEFSPCDGAGVHVRLVLQLVVSLGLCRLIAEAARRTVSACVSASSCECQNMADGPNGRPCGWG